MRLAMAAASISVAIIASLLAAPAAASYPLMEPNSLAGMPNRNISSPPLIQRRQVQQQNANGGYEYAYSTKRSKSSKRSKSDKSSRGDEDPTDMLSSSPPSQAPPHAPSDAPSDASTLPPSVSPKPSLSPTTASTHCNDFPGSVGQLLDLPCAKPDLSSYKGSCSETETASKNYVRLELVVPSDGTGCFASNSYEIDNVSYVRLACKFNAVDSLSEAKFHFGVGSGNANAHYVFTNPCTGGRVRFQRIYHWSWNGYTYFVTTIPTTDSDAATVAADANDQFGTVAGHRIVASIYTPVKNPSSSPSDTNASSVPSAIPRLSPDPSSGPTDMPNLSTVPSSSPLDMPGLSSAPSSEPTSSISLRSEPSLAPSSSASTSATAAANQLDYLASPFTSFNFNDGSLADGKGKGTLQVEGRGKVNGSEYIFGKNEGPTLVPPILLTNSGEYAIEMSVKLQNPVADGDGIIKMLDFNNLSSNHGAYIIESRLGYIAEGGEGLLESTEVNIQAGVYAHLVITRRYDTRVVTFYVDGVKVLSLDDWSEDFVIGSSGLRFFQDDGTSSTDEFCVKSAREARCHSGSGSIDYIKIYDSPLTSDDVALLFIQGEESPTVAACQCDSGGVCIDKALSKDHLVNVCIRCDRVDDFAIAMVDEFEYDQGGIVEVAVERGAERMTSTVFNGEEYTMISTFLPKSFFYGYGTDDDVLPIRGSGTVSLAAKMTLKDEKRSLRGVQTLQRQKEQLQRQPRRGQEQMRISVDFDLEFSEIESPRVWETSKGTAFMVLLPLTLIVLLAFASQKLRQILKPERIHEPIK